MKNKRQLLFRIAAIVIILAVAAVMFVIGRGHTIYFDNQWKLSTRSPSPQVRRSPPNSPRETEEWPVLWDRRSP